MKIWLLPTVGAVLLLAACTTAPIKEPVPDVPLSEAFRSISGETGGDTVDTRWWASFGDTVLAQPWVLNLGMVAFVTGLGLVLPVATSAAMSSRVSNAGQAAAMIGLLQMRFGAVGNSLANAALDAWPRVSMQAVMAGFTLAVALFVWRLGRR